MTKRTTRTCLLSGSAGASVGFDVAGSCAKLHCVQKVANKKKAANRRKGGITLAHEADFFRLDDVGHADLAGLAEGIDRIAEIFLREFVDVIVGAFFRNLHDAPANLQI